MRKIGLDFETYYDEDCSVKTQGNWRYTHDKSFDPYMLSVYDGEESWVGMPNNFNWDAIQSGNVLIAHNAGFERQICRWLCEQGRAPDLTKNPWRCTANMTSFLASSRSLDQALLVLEKKEISKGMRNWMKGKTWAEAIAAGKAEELQNYALNDVRECWHLDEKYNHRWPQMEQDLSELTMKQCARGVQIDVALLDQYRTKLQEVIFNLEQSLPWTERGAKPTSPIAIAEQCRLVGIPAPPIKTHDEEGFEVWQKTFGPLHAWVYSAGQWRSLGKLLSSLDTIKERLRPDDTIDFSLLYFGAHTGRWSGGGSGLNLQNLKKVPLFLKNGHLLTPPTGLKSKEFKEWIAAETDFALDVRKLFIPRPGRKFILSDLSQIEPRVLAWLTGNVELLNLLKGGMSIYEAFARISMNWTGGKLSAESPELYQLAKIQVLGLGFGCGWEKFITIASGYDVFLTEEKSRELVTGFRQQNPRTTSLWKTLDDQFRDSVGGNFEMGLPSGRSMTYRDVLREVKSKRNSVTKKYEKRFVYSAKIGWERCELYGGLLTENLVQATARDVFASQILQIEAQVGDVIFTSHDEAIVEADMDVPAEAVGQVMSICPEWIEGLPVSAEAKDSMHYRK